VHERRKLWTKKSSFTLYISSSAAAAAVSIYSLSHQQYANDTQLFISIINMYTHLILMNRTKLASLYGAAYVFTSSSHGSSSNAFLLTPINLTVYSSALLSYTLASCNFNPVSQISFPNTFISLSDTIKTFRATFDSHLTYHIQSIIKASMLFPSQGLPPHPFVNRLETAKKQPLPSSVPGLIMPTSHSMVSRSDFNLAKLQRVQFAAARNRSAIPISINLRIRFELATVTFKVLTAAQLSYLRSLGLPIRSSSTLL
jgi:hypothetical protein